MTKFKITENGSVTNSRGTRLTYDVTNLDTGDLIAMALEFKYAMLIASAPDLLEACKALVAVCSNFRDKGAAYTGTGRYQSCQFKMALSTADKAIAQAEGGE